MPRFRSGTLALSVLLLSFAPASRAQFALDPWSDSPDGDPLVQRLDLPAAEFPLERPPSRALRALTEHFVLTGELPEGDTASDVQFTPDGTKIVVAHRDTQNLIVFDAATRAFVQAIPLSGSPGGLAISPDGTRAVTANVFEDTASIVDLLAGTEIAVVAVGDQPGVVRITPDGTKAAVGNTVSGSISVIDLAGATELREIAGTGFVTSISVSFESGAIPSAFSQFEVPNDSTLVHPDFFANAIDLVNLDDGTVTTLPSQSNPRGIDATPDGSKVVVSHTGSVRRVTVIDVAAGAIDKVIATFADLTGAIAVDPTGTKAVAAIQNACRVVDLVNSTVSGNLNTASVSQIHTTADGNHALTIGFRGSLISYATETIVKDLNNVVSTPLGAVSPTAPRGTMVANVFGEDLLVVNTSGAAGFLEGRTSSGPPPEGDKARAAALSPDGSKAVVTSILSDNATIVDVATLSVDAIVATGDRPSEVAITPDGSKAVVANLDSNFASVIDLVSPGVTNVTISRRAGQVEISPDGTFAYLAVVADGDGVWRINLNTLSVEGPKLFTGNMGGVLYAFNQSSGLTLSHDGTTLVTCNSFDDSITIVDATAWSILATVFVGDFPTRAIFSDDDSVIYVANRDGDTISRVSNSPGFPPLGTINVGQQPFEMTVDPTGATLYVSNYQDANVGVVDLVSGTMPRTIALPNNPAGMALHPSGTTLYVATGTWSVTLGPGPVFSISHSGEFSAINTTTQTITDQVLTGLPPGTLAFTAATGTAAVPSPFGDGLTLIDTSGPVSVENVPLSAGTSLSAPVPNPTREGTEIRFVVSRTTHVTLGVYDAAGRRVAIPFEGLSAAGEHRVNWDARAASGAPVVPGVYFLRMEADGRSMTRRLVVVR